MKRTLITTLGAAALAVALASSSAYAAVKTVALSPDLNPPGTPGISGSSTENGSIDTNFTFTLDTKAYVTGSVTLSVFEKDDYTPGTWQLFNSSNISQSSAVLLVWNAGSSNYSIGVPNILLSAGNYYYELTGTAETRVAPGVSVFGAASTVPEASTWVMVIAGFAGLGFVGNRSRRMAISIA